MTAMDSSLTAHRYHLSVTTRTPTRLVGRLDADFDDATERIARLAGLVDQPLDLVIAGQIERIDFARIAQLQPLGQRQSGTSV
jgi:hypothetical protein